ncbi:MAG: selenium-dependent molybdenum cofactor biosynthesis protein YqeB [Anaerolineales bacterium]
MTSLVIIRGGGDLASGVALRLHRAGIRVLVTELEKPTAVRRTVAFAEAVYSGRIDIEGVVGQRIAKPEEVNPTLDKGEIPVLVDPLLSKLPGLVHEVIVDARMTKRAPDVIANAAGILIGLGPGFVAGENCHAVVETVRGHNLGRVFWQGSAQADTGVPGSIAQYNKDRVLRAPAAGYVETHAEIGQRLRAGELLAIVSGKELRAPFDGVLRGLIHPSIEATPGMKIGDMDPRNDPSFCRRVSDKALAIGGGVLEALLTRSEIRAKLWV